jgi:hypothetical protein
MVFRKFKTGTSIRAARSSIVSGLIGRHVRADGALVAGNVEQPAVEDRVGNAVRSREMNVTGKRFPGLVDEPGAFVEEPLSILVDHDAVGIDQHHGRGVTAARVDRFDVHAVPIARNVRASICRHANPVAGIIAGAGGDQLECFRARAKMLQHHRAAALETTGGEDYRVGIDRCRDIVVGSNRDAVDAAVGHPQPRRGAIIANLHSCSRCALQKPLDDLPPAAGRLNARWTDAKIVDGNAERDAVGLQPSDRFDGMLRERPIIVRISQTARGFQHVVFKTGFDPVRRSHSHVRRAPAGIAAGFRPRTRDCSAADSAAASPAAPWPTTTSLLTFVIHPSRPWIRSPTRRHRYRLSIPSQSDSP